MIDVFSDFAHVDRLSDLDPQQLTARNGRESI